VTSVFIQGMGAVSPAGWGVAVMRDTLKRNQPLAVSDLTRPGWKHALKARPVPPPTVRPAFLSHPRLRRTSPITHYAVAAALEALGLGTVDAVPKKSQIGIILCVMTGCVNYSRRFYDETLKDPATASPLVFPETVFNAPASHLATVLGAKALNYTLVGDPGTFVQGLALGADWLLAQRVNQCLVIGAEELDWLTADGNNIFNRQSIVSAGAGALLLSTERSEVTLASVTDAQLFFDRKSRAVAAQAVRKQLSHSHDNQLLCDGLQGIRSVDDAESEAWQDWGGVRISLKTILGEGFAAASAWQCVIAVDALRQRQFENATVSVVGCNEQAIGVSFRSESRF
jgi:3-oxoacyl-(acyl-carrier-protein) synthase